MGKKNFVSAGRLFSQHSSFLITSHIRADGDAVGSVLGLGLALEAAGKKVSMVLKDGVARNFHFMPGWEKIQKTAEGDFDLVIILDSADFERSGGVTGDRRVDINIDHHVTNTRYGELNLVKPKAVATSAILAEWLPRWKLGINKEIAEALLVGMITDTIGFRTTNMNPKALHLAADLIEHGANLPDLYAKALMRKSYEAAKYWGLGLVQLEREGKLIWSSLSLDNRKTAKYPGSDDADFCNILSNIDGCDISILFIEQKNHTIKVSWRAPGGQDISGLAMQFGGGGHPAAAGADVPGTLDEVREKVLYETRKLIRAASQKKKTNLASEG